MVRGVLSGEIPQFSVLLLQPVKKLGKLHLDPLNICTELFGFRMDRLYLNGYVTSFIGEVFKVCLFQTICVSIAGDGGIVEGARTQREVWKPSSRMSPFITTGVRVWTYFAKNSLGSIVESTTCRVFTIISKGKEKFPQSLT